MCRQSERSRIQRNECNFSRATDVLVSGTKINQHRYLSQYTGAVPSADVKWFLPTNKITLHPQPYSTYSSTTTKPTRFRNTTSINGQSITGIICKPSDVPYTLAEYLRFCCM